MWKGQIRVIILPEAGLVSSQASEDPRTVVGKWKNTSLSSFRSADITGSRNAERNVVGTGEDVETGTESRAYRELREGRGYKRTKNERRSWKYENEAV